MAGARLAVDVGTARIGVARCASDQIMAVPVETVPAGPQAVQRIVDLAKEYGAQIIYIGLPLSLKGTDTASTAMAREFAQSVAHSDLDCEVRFVDERLSTAGAAANLRAAGRNDRSSRSVIDQAAAILILEHALDIERRQARPAGTAVRGETP